MKIPRSFSLLTLMLIAAIIALSLVVYSSRTELRKSKSLVSDLVEQTGFIQVDDPKQLHVRQLRRIVPMTWSFQIFAPEGKSFALNIGEGTIDKGTGYPPKIISGKVVGSGQQGTVTLQLRRIHSGSNSGWILRDFGKINDMGGTFIIDPERFDWLEQSLELTVLNIDFHESIRKSDNSTSVILWKRSENDPTDLEATTRFEVENPRVFMIWLEPLVK